MEKLIENFNNLNLNKNYHQKIDFYKPIKKYQILILVAGNGIFWVKSKSPKLGNFENDFSRKNEKEFIYLNKSFIISFINKIVKLKKTRFGIISSRRLTNIKSILDEIRKLIPSLPEYTDIVGQKFHDSSYVTKLKPNNFKRDINKIIECKHNKFDEKKILIIESEQTKIGNTKDNSIVLKYLFSEENLIKSENNSLILESIKKEQEYLINYLLNLIASKPDDIREYLKKYPFENFK